MLGNGPKESTTTTEALEEEDEHEDYNNYNGCVGGGYTTRPRDQRWRWMQEKIDNRPGGLATTTECWFSLLSGC